MGVVAVACAESYLGWLSGIALNDDYSKKMKVCGQRHQSRCHGNGNAIWARLNCGFEADEPGVAH
jgi:hypothetical protein